MERVEAHLRVSSWYEALLTTTSVIEKLNRQKKYEDAFILSATALHSFAMYKCPTPDEYKAIVIRVVACLAKQKEEKVVLEGLRLVFEALAVTQLSGMEKLGFAVESWFEAMSLPMNPAILSWIGPYMPPERQYAVAARGCYLNPLLMKEEKSFCLYLLSLLSVGNLRVAKEAVAAYSGPRGPVSDIAELSVIALQKKSSKGIKLIRTRCRDHLTQDMRSLLSTIEARFCASDAAEDVLD